MLSFKILPILFFLLNFSNLSNGDCGRSYQVRGAVIGGSSLTSIQRGHFPWVAALVMNDNSYFCGGVLISSNKVLTAAHCMLPKDQRNQLLAREVRILLGVFDLKDPFEVGRFSAATREIRLHPDWNPDTKNYDGDVAILVMEEQAPINSYIQPICLIPPDSPLLSIDQGVVVGYGLSSTETSAPEPIPKILDVPIHGNEKCFLKNKELAGISSSKTFCAGSGTGSGVCLGDSGSGLYVKSGETYYLRGLVSASLITLKRTCDVNNYAIYTKISEYYNWIAGETSLGSGQSNNNQISNVPIVIQNNQNLRPTGYDNIFLNNIGRPQLNQSPFVIQNSNFRQQPIFYNNQISQRIIGPQPVQNVQFIQDPRFIQNPFQRTINVQPGFNPAFSNGNFGPSQGFIQVQRVETFCIPCSALRGGNFVGK
ncbi:chymotrypsin-like protease CTRL-1 [Chironomus tepperi]|uniref:chymotrypsin-like protease CTRL-1 n=1 Tax=Chironomus tepperi TaxID=113505 RepID=UPI00391F9261